jgi:hypothetical protein
MATPYKKMVRFGEHFATTAFVVVADPVGAGFVDSLAPNKA